MIAYDAAFAGLHHDIHHAIADGNLVAVNSTMNGRHTAPWAVYTADGAVDTVFPPTNKTFAATHSHSFRIEDGMIVEHWDNREDLGMPGNLAGFRRPRPTCSRWRARSTALSVLDLRHGEHVALVGFGDRARAAWVTHQATHLWRCRST